jgi:hypothetical protein
VPYSPLVFLCAIASLSVTLRRLGLDIRLDLPGSVEGLLELLFADDVRISLRGPHVDAKYARICTAVHEWADLTGFRFNIGPKKTAVVVVRRGHRAQARALAGVPRCVVSGGVIPQVETYEYLGVHMPAGGLRAIQRDTLAARLRSAAAKAAVLGASGLSDMNPRVAREAFFSEWRAGLLHAIAVWLNLSVRTSVQAVQVIQDKVLRLTLGVPEVPSVVLEAAMGAQRVRETALKARVDVVFDALSSPPSSLLRSALRADGGRGPPRGPGRRRSAWWITTLLMVRELDAELADLADSVVQDTVDPDYRIGGRWARLVKQQCDVARVASRDVETLALVSVVELAPFLCQIPPGRVAPFLSVPRDSATYWRACALAGVRGVVRSVTYIALRHGCLADAWCPRCGTQNGWTLMHTVLDCVPVGDGGRLPALRERCLASLRQRWHDADFSLVSAESRSVFAAVLGLPPPGDDFFVPDWGPSYTGRDTPVARSLRQQVLGLTAALAVLSLRGLRDRCLQLSQRQHSGLAVLRPGP